MLKNSTSEELVAAVRAVVGGGSYIHPKMAALLTKQLWAPTGQGPLLPAAFHPRTGNTAALAKGYTNKEISSRCTFP